MRVKILRALLLVASMAAVECFCRVAALYVPARLYACRRSDVWWRLQWVQNRRDGVGLGQVPYLAYDPSRGWATRPNLRNIREGLSTISTNSRGLRGVTEHSFGCRSGKKRVLVLGDSFAFGEEVDDDETFSARLERDVPGLEAINLGVGGYGHDQMLAALRDENRYCPDLVLLSYVGQDWVRNNLAFRDYAKPFFEFDAEGKLVETGRPVPPPEEILRRHRFRSRFLDLAKMVVDQWHPPRDRTALVLDLIVKEAAASHVRFAMFFGPDRIIGKPDDSLARERFAQYCRSRSIACKIVEPHEDEPAPPGYGHWSPQEHAEVAKQLAPFVTALISGSSPRDRTARAAVAQAR